MRIITGTRPKVEVKTVSYSTDESIANDIPTNLLLDQLRWFKEDHKVPIEAVETKKKDPNFDMLVYTWTWYEITI